MPSGICGSLLIVCYVPSNNHFLMHLPGNVFVARNTHFAQQPLLVYHWWIADKQYSSSRSELTSLTGIGVISYEDFTDAYVQATSGLCC
eukprot:12937-Heterococcus_DN1.PRE.2